MKELSPLLRRRTSDGLYRTRRVITGAQGVEVSVAGKTLLTFCSNDYLGLANHPRVVAAMQDAAARCGTGSGAAHLLSGHNLEHHALEEELAAFVQRPRALLFSTGYMANLGVMTALLGRKDLAYQDRLNHASLLDAARLAGARLVRFRHRDMDDLARRLASGKPGESLIASDGIFSMDGDRADVVAMAELARRHGAWLMIDDAHGFGVCGPGGRGTLAALGLGVADVPILMGTLGKALGTWGAFVAGSEDLIEWLIQAARTYIYTTAPPPANAAATRASLALAAAEDWRRQHLFALIKRFRAGARQLGLPLADSDSPIQPLIVGSAQRAVAVSEALLRNGIWIPAIRPPTVPREQSRLRITLSAAHTEAQVDSLLAHLETIFASGR